MNEIRSMSSRLFELFAPFRMGLLFCFALTMCYQVLSFVTSYFIGSIVDGLVQVYPKEYMYRLLIVAISVYLLQSVLYYLHWVYEVNHINRYINKYLSCKTLEKVFGLSAGQHNNQNSGISISAIRDGENAVKNSVSTIVYECIPALMKIFISLIALFWLHVVYGVIATTMIGVTLVYGFFLNKKTIPKIEMSQRFSHRINAFRMEVMRHLSLVYAHGVQKAVAQEYAEKHATLADKVVTVWGPYVKHNVYRSTFSPVAKCAFLFVSIQEIYAGRISIGTLVIGSIWINMAMDGVMRIAYLQRNLLLWYTDIERYFALYDAQSDLKAGIEEKRKPVSIKGDITFKDVYFHYSNTEYIPCGDNERDLSSGPKDKSKKPPVGVLKGINLHISAGEKVGIVGQTGAGKSTLVSLLLRESDPVDGQICIDGIPLPELHDGTFHRFVGYVQQSVGLFDDTLEKNICFGLNGERKDITQADMERVLSQSRITSFNERLTDGLNTRIGENGVRLSGGERQRVGIARALIRNPKILILDEATSSLDSSTEKEVSEAIQEASKDKTTIIIAHRLSTLKFVDRIIVLDKGKIIAEGTHAELYESCDLYKTLATIQNLPC